MGSSGDCCWDQCKPGGPSVRTGCESGTAGFCVFDRQFSPACKRSFYNPKDQPKSGAALMEPVRKVRGQWVWRGVSEDTAFSRAVLSGARRQGGSSGEVCDCVVPGLPSE